MHNLEFAARYHQQELLREARGARLARGAQPGQERHTARRHQLTTAVVSLLMIVALLALI